MSKLQAYTGQIMYYIGELKDRKLKDKYKKRMQQIVQRNDESSEIDLIALINEIEWKLLQQENKRCEERE